MLRAKVVRGAPLVGRTYFPPDGVHRFPNLGGSFGPMNAHLAIFDRCDSRRGRAVTRLSRHSLAHEGGTMRLMRQHKGRRRVIDGQLPHGLIQLAAEKGGRESGWWPRHHYMPPIEIAQVLQ